MNLQCFKSSLVDIVSGLKERRSTKEKGTPTRWAKSAFGSIDPIFLVWFVFFEGRREREILLEKLKMSCDGINMGFGSRSDSQHSSTTSGNLSASGIDD